MGVFVCVCVRLVFYICIHYKNAARQHARAGRHLVCCVWCVCVCVSVCVFVFVYLRVCLWCCIYAYMTKMPMRSKQGLEGVRYVVLVVCACVCVCVYTCECACGVVHMPIITLGNRSGQDGIGYVV